MQFEKDILRKADELYEEELGIIRRLLTNREKAVLVDASRTTSPLNDLLRESGLPRSSHFHGGEGPRCCACWTGPPGGGAVGEHLDALDGGHEQTGDLEAAQREIARLERLSAQASGVEYALALYVERGEHDRALDRLERAGRDAAVPGDLNVDHALDPIRRDVRFRQAAQRLQPR